MKSPQVFKSTLITLLLSSLLAASETKTSNECDTAYDACLEQCEKAENTSEQCFTQCEATYEVCLSSAEKK